MMPKTTFLLTALALWWLWLYRTHPGLGTTPAAGAGAAPLIGPPVPSGSVPPTLPLPVPGQNFPVGGSLP